MLSIPTSKFLVRASLAALVATLTVGLAACTPTPTPTPSETVAPIVYETAPLTGLQFEQGTNPYLAGPVVMGKIDNSEPARPQAGLNSADVVFDELVEGGITRFLAVFHSQIPERFGPLRSVRPMDPDIAQPFGGIICYSGGQKVFVQMMKATKLYNCNETGEQRGETMVRVTDRYAPHNLFVLAQTLQSQHLDLAPPELQWQFSERGANSTAGLTGALTNKFTVTFPQAEPSYIWDDASKHWLRWYGTDKHMDADAGTQVQAKNVVVCEVEVDRSYGSKRYGNIPRTILEGEGRAWLFTNGKYVQITWKKTSPRKRLQLLDSTGAEVQLAPGNTWFELMPKSGGKLTVEKVEPSASPSPTPTDK